MDLSTENPFGDLLNKAVKLKGHQQAQLRPRYDSWPSYFQHSMFMQESVLSVRPKPFPERIQAAEAMKTKGNDNFSQGNLEEAVAEYEKALAVFKYIINKDPEWKKKGIEDSDLELYDYSCDNHPEDQKRLDSLKISCWLNIAVCKYKRKDYKTCIQACNDTLELDPRNIKALYRRAQALITPKSSGAIEFESALTDLEQAYKIDPSNCQVIKFLRDLKAQKNHQKQLDKQTFTGMFERGKVYEDMEDKEDNQVEHENEEMSKSQKQRKQQEEAFQKEVLDAERLAYMCEAKGQFEYATEIRTKIEQAKKAHACRLKQVDFFHPTREMIQDAKQNGIDLTDPNVQQMLHDLQEEKRTKKLQINSQEEQEEKEENGHFTSDEIDRILDSMTNAQITTMLRQEGIAYHQVKDCQEFRQLARQTLVSQLKSSDSIATSTAGAFKNPNTSYFWTIFMGAIAWALLRAYMTGGFGMLQRLLLSAAGIDGDQTSIATMPLANDDDFLDY